MTRPERSSRRCFRRRGPAPTFFPSRLLSPSRSRSTSGAYASPTAPAPSTTIFSSSINFRDRHCDLLRLPLPPSRRVPRRSARDVEALRADPVHAEAIRQCRLDLHLHHLARRERRGELRRMRRFHPDHPHPAGLEPPASRSRDSRDHPAAADRHNDRRLRDLPGTASAPGSPAPASRRPP